MFCVGGNGNTVLGALKKKSLCDRMSRKRGECNQSSGGGQSLTINSIRTRRSHRGHRMRLGHLIVNYQQVEVTGNEVKREILTEKRQLS